MTAPIDDISSLPGRKVYDQENTPIGEVTEIYAIDGDGQAHWVRVEAKFGMGDTRKVLVPLARLKEEDGELLVPYSKSHIGDTPEVEGDEISDDEERQLRDHYGIDTADQELRSNNDSYATLVPEKGTAKRVEDVDSLETPDADKVDDETRKRLEDPGSAEIRHITAEDVTEGAGRPDTDGSDEESESGGESEADAETAKASDEK